MAKPIFSPYSKLSFFMQKQPRLLHFCNFKTSMNTTHQPHGKNTFSSLQAFPSFSSDLTNRKGPSDFASALILSSKTKMPLLGIQVHAQILKTGISSDTFFQNNLLTMYSKSGSLNCAFKVFDDMSERNLVSWTSMISGSIQNGELEMGMKLFQEMRRYGVSPNEFAFGSALKACSGMEAIELGSSLHCITLKIGIEMNEFVGGPLVDMYAKCKDIKMAECVFECIHNLDIACWNALIGGYAFNGYNYEMMELVSFMHQSGINMDQFTFINALKGCSIQAGLRFGQQLHTLVIQNKLEFSSSVMNSLVNMYFKVGRKDLALMVFSRMHHKNVISWNTVIAGLAQDENVIEVVGSFSAMLLTGFRPNHVTFSILLRLCGIVGHLYLGLQFYGLVYHLGFHKKNAITNSVIYMFSRCGVVDDACCIFKHLPTRDLSTWNEMISGYNLNDCSIDALRLFHNLHKVGIEANEITYSSILVACCRTERWEIISQAHASIVKSGFDSNNYVCCSLINAYARYGMAYDLYKIFCDIDLPDLASWGAIISAFLQQGCDYVALVLLNSLREAGEKLDEFVLCSTLNACANIAALNQSRCIHVHVLMLGYERHVCVASAVLDAYAKCGDINSSRIVFDQLWREGDVIFFNTMISAYAQHGLVEEAVELFERMKEANLQPSHATFSSVISACSHLGLVDQGRGFFHSISSKYGLKPSAENFACLIDLLARNGYLEESREVIENMPFEPWPAIWRSLLSGCRIHGNRKLGEMAAQRLLQLMPNNDAAYVLLSKVHAEGGYWEDAASVRRQMIERRLRKEPGYSWIGI